MKKVLLATTMLVAGASIAAAEVTVSGDARMGVVNNFAGDTSFNSRARVAFALSAESESGLSFGASFRADNALGASSGTAGSVFVQGAFGKLSMGDLDGAAQNAVGQVAGVGYVNQGDLNEVTYIGKGTNPNVNYEYSAGAFTAYLSTGQNAALAPWAIGAKYAGEGYTVSLGYENNDNGTKHVIVGATGSFAGASLSAIYGKASGTISGSQYALSASYTFSGITGTVFAADDSELRGAKAAGFGVSYDLGGGATFKAGYAKNRTTNADAYDAGITLKF
jgi:outer membrane protein OmpU